MKSLLLSISTIILLICSSCLDIHVDKQSKIDTQAIARQVKEQVQAEINDISLPSVNLNDTLAVVPDSATSQIQTITAPVPVVIEKIDVSISNDNYRHYYDEYFRYQVIIIVVCSICALAFALVVILLIFFYKRTKNRNMLIAKAIENSYMLPDSFYTGRETEPVRRETEPVMGGYKQQSDINNNCDNTPTPPPMPRNSRLFDSAVKYISVGVGIFFIFAVCGADPIAAFGIIPILIGVGKLLTYFGIGR